MSQLTDQEQNLDEWRWRLEDIYQDNQQWEDDFRKVMEGIGEIERFHGHLADSAAQLLAALQTIDRIEETEERVYAYASMRLDEDNTNPVYQALRDRAAGLDTRLRTALSFFEPELLAMPDDRLQQFRSSEPGLAHYGFLLDQILRQKPYTLTAAEEEIVARSGDLAQSPRLIFKMIDNADLEFPIIKDEEGKEVAVTHGRYSTLIKSRDRRVRREAFTSYLGAYGKLQNTIAATYAASVKKDIFLSAVHHFPSALEAGLFGDNVPVRVYDNLIETVRAHLKTLHRYVSLRKKRLGLDEIHMYDLYVPLVPDLEWKVSYTEAIELMKKGLAPLGAEYLAIAEEGVNSRWIDVYERKGKTSGAYSEATYGVHPYILLNYQENLNDGLFTLCHEMGHALHSYYANRAQPFTYAGYSIFVAEVASTVNESLMVNHLLRTVDDSRRRAFLINFYLEQIRTTLFRQVMFAEFEKIVHQRAESGEGLTPQLLKEIYHRLNVDYFGPEMVVDSEIDLEWARIPHFYTPFYVYKYATGISAAVALSRSILDEGQPAVERYLNFLRRGGSGYPLDLLREAGVDMESPQPVAKAMRLFAGLLAEMEKL